MSDNLENNAQGKTGADTAGQINTGTQAGAEAGQQQAGAEQNGKPGAEMKGKAGAESKAKPVKKKKKHRVRNFFLIFFLIIFILFVIIMLIPTGPYSEYSDDYKSTEVTALVDELAKGGQPLCSNYEGEYGIWGPEASEEDLREPYTDTENAQTVTWMVYIVGSNLESENGCATADLQEMIDSANGKNLNIVIETGGAKEWQNTVVSADTRQRWLIQDSQISECDDAGQGSMCTKDSLEDFVKWSAEEYPADRYILTMWDHGGGTLGGYGYDENYEEDGLDLTELSGALNDSGVKFDVVSFDACLMATLETAYAFENSSDYLLASEETEPGYGWYYTDVMKELSDDPSMPTVELGARLIDDYGESYGNEGVTLSLIDLREIPALYEKCLTYYKNSDKKLNDQEGFTELSTARSTSRSYADGENEQVDLIDYVQRTEVDGGEDVVKALFNAVKYRNTSTLSGSYGLATYFPYLSLDVYQDVITDMSDIGCNGAQSFYDKFLSIMASGTGGNESGQSQLTGYTEQSENYENEDWYEADASQDMDYDTISNTDDLVLDYNEKDEQYTLSLPEETWDSIADIQLQVMVDDGEGYIDLGSDQQYNWADNGDLIVDFDNTWTSIDGQTVALYAGTPDVNGDVSLFTGKVPAELNGEKDIDIYIQWKQEGDGYAEPTVLGYLPTDGGQALPKGYLELKKGDVIQFLCDYYTYDGDYDDSYYFGDPITVSSQDALTVESTDIGDSSTLCWVCLTDLFQQNWYTEALEITYQ